MKIYKTILEIRKNVGTVHKNGKNSFHKYNYATANDVLHEVREQCNEKGLIIIPTGISDIDIAQKEGGGYVHTWTQTYMFVDSEDGSHIEVNVRASGEDKGDKSAYKGMTGGLKYALIQTFLLPTDDDPENDTKYPTKSTTTKAAPRTNQSVGSDLPWLNEGTPEWDRAEVAVARDGFDAAIIKIKQAFKVSKEAYGKLKEISA